jgi:hypothetical protein
MKIAESASRSICQRYGSVDLGPYQNFLDLAAMIVILWFIREYIRD